MGRPIKKSFIGNTANAGDQIVVRVKIGTNVEADGFIVKQKGSRRFLVSDGVNTGICMLANLADGVLTADTMTITLTPDVGPAVRAHKITNRCIIDFNDVKHAWSFSTSGSDGAAAIEKA